ncbi:glutamate racemase [bacterium]|nr:glutamate racemase [bacterium]
MPNLDAPIGVFDSGIGGLTVLSAIQKLLPHENLVYLGDTARVPYGTKSRETVTRYSIQNTLFLMEQNVKAVVVACNTASAHALEYLKGKFSVPVLGVIEPGALAAHKATVSGSIGVMGTEGTIKSEAYKKALHRLSNKHQVFGVACPLLVSLAEEGWLTGDIVDLVLEKYLAPLKKTQNPDTVILGCTHYPLLKNAVQKCMGNKVTLVDSAHETAQALKEILIQNKIASPSALQGTLQVYATDNPDTMARLGGHFLGRALGSVHQADTSGLV